YPYINGTKLPDYISRIIYYYGVYFNVNVQNPDSDKAISIYPNPATSNINIVTDGQEDATVTLINMTGQAVRSTDIPAGKQVVSMNIQGLAKGNYILHVHSGSKSIGKKQVTIH